MVTQALNLVELFKKWGVNQGRPIFILGHDQCDVDSFLSGKLLERLGRHFGLAIRFICLDSQMDEETTRIVRQLGFKVEEVYATEDDRQVLKSNADVILVDHYQTKRVALEQVVMCIDHHPTQELPTYAYYQNEVCSACAALIYRAISTVPELDTMEVKQWVATAIMVDTCSLKSSKTQPAERKLIQAWSEQQVIDFNQLYKVGLCLTDLSQSTEVLIQHGLKHYQYVGEKVCSSYIQVDRELSAWQKRQFVAEIQNEMQESSIAMWVFLIVNVHHQKTIEYRITTRTFQEQGYGFICSRGQHIMPAIEKMFLAKYQH